MSGVVLTALYVPASRPDRFAKAVATRADVVIADLEDALSPDAKERARAQLPAFAASLGSKPGQVRINGVGTPWHEADCVAVDGLASGIGVRLPDVADVATLATLAARWPDRALHVLIESPLGVENAFALAGAPGVSTLGLGEADLRSRLGVRDAAGLAWARGRVVNAARAAGLPAPLGSVFAHLGDDDALRRDTAALADLGFVGRSVIHPSQIEVVREAFRPSAADVERALAVVDGLAEAEALGEGALVLPDGRFVDAAMVQRERDVLALAEQLG